MPRPPKIDVDPDGSATVRQVRLPPAVWGIVQRYATSSGLDTETSLRVLLQQLGALVAAGELSWLSADWRALATDAPPAASRLMIDVSKLHRSERTKSGFYGVYVNGMGFRAIARGEVLGTFGSAEEAAWRRYQHYTQHGLSYGELEVAIEAERKAGTAGTERELRSIVLETAKLTGTAHLYAAHMTAAELATYATAGEQP